ncbi:hypothetical protein BDFB_013091 [Asbolus verrucosus]|uniref:Uncharacterized protein n=1 Tax=Asbolus verrucosus TaxID=1661398 RepID=A0A482W8R3_ASBVE|nr:hypothetical protein BDFB_013091 [Asbolus verrucosus]
MDKYENKINTNLMMLETLVDLKGAMDGFGTNQKPVDIKDIFGRFITDLFSSVFLSQNVKEFFMKVVSDTVAYQEKHDVYRED